MKKLSILLILALGFQLEAQNIDDNFITFSYIQVPLIPIEEGNRFVHITVEQDVAQANQDSSANYHIRLANATSLYEQKLSEWYTKMSLLQQQENTGGVSQSQNYPIKPCLEYVPTPIMHSLDVQNLSSTVESLKIPGFQNGKTGIMVKIKVLPLRDIRINERKSGSGAQTKYNYSCNYYLPVKIEVYSPSGAPLFEKVIGNKKRTKSLGVYKSKFEFADWFMKNRASVYAQAEKQGRIASIKASSQVLENQFGFVKKSRKAEIYSVKKYKDYSYSDIASAYSKTNEALLQIGNSVDRSAAYDALKTARNMWTDILEESNLQNKKERINAKVSAIIWCNIAEISVWMGDFNNVDVHTQNIKNSGVFKAKNHINGEGSFYKDQKIRWAANFE